jgi:uncharacterized protein YciI
MKAIKGSLQWMAEGRQAEQAGQLPHAATAYQRVVDADPANKEAVGRLLLIYRKLKEYRKELAVIDAALNAVAQRDKIAQDKWSAAHPEVAKLGKAVLRSLGGQSATAYGTDPLVERLMKRKELVERRLGGGRVKKVAKPARKKTNTKAAPNKRNELVRQKAAAAVAKKEAGMKRKAAADERKAAAQERKAAAAEERLRKSEANIHPSLFIVSLRYLAPLREIDSAMAKHLAFLQKHYTNGTFLVSGRQVPRTGGIIIARGKDRTAVEQIMDQDPFIKGKLASFDIVEFVASQIGNGLKRWVTPASHK